jgi:hypothetical protein
MAGPALAGAPMGRAPRRRQDWAMVGSASVRWSFQIGIVRLSSLVHPDGLEGTGPGRTQQIRRSPRLMGLLSL